MFVKHPFKRMFHSGEDILIAFDVAAVQRASSVPPVVHWFHTHMLSVLALVMLCPSPMLVICCSFLFGKTQFSYMYWLV